LILDSFRRSLGDWRCANVRANSKKEAAEALSVRALDLSPHLPNIP
jgi:hypothetical protein